MPSRKEVLALLFLCAVIAAVMGVFSWLLEPPALSPSHELSMEGARVVTLCAAHCRPGRSADEIARNHYELCVCGGEP